MAHLPSALDLARAQFAFVVVWHFLFPAFTVGLASFLAVLEGLWLITKRPVSLRFFLEAGFLGVMLFGLRRVGPKLHFAATCLVSFGTLMSTFWILVANSWMQTPAGFMRTPDGRFLPINWVEALFNPSFPFRYMHTVVAAYLTTALVVGGVGAFHLLRDRANERGRGTTDHVSKDCLVRRSMDGRRAIDWLARCGNAVRAAALTHEFVNDCANRRT
jgi:cytochrome d ubiquinol oxidase subunit I